LHLVGYLHRCIYYLNLISKSGASKFAINMQGLPKKCYGNVSIDRFRMLYLQVGG